MSERFWAPTRPTITPDAVAVALLSPHGGDRAGDLGASLLGMHRAGAAACEAIAKGAVPSEKRLLEALAECRSAMGGQAADAVSKSMEARYAGLLVRDMLDDAETAATGLYRACVTKGVAPPLAASRVGAVYGVPSSELARYRALATDPRANPIALTDAADRTLLGYVAKVVAAEVGEVKEEVSKAGSTMTEVEFERVHPRGPDGRFTETPDAPVVGAAARLRARLGLSESAPEVVVAPEKKPTKAKTGRLVRQRVKRRQRVQRTAPETSEAATTEEKLSLAPTKTKLAAKVAMKSKQTMAIRQKLGMKTTTKDQLDGDLHIGPELLRINTDDLMSLPMPVATPGEYDTIYQKLGFAMPAGEGIEFRGAASGTGLYDDPRRFRAGWLVEAAHSPESMEERDDGKMLEIEHRLDHAADLAKLRVSDVGGTGPVVIHLSAKQMAGPGADDYVAGERRSAAASVDWVNPKIEEEIDAEEEHIELMTDMKTGEQMLIHWQPVMTPHGHIRKSHRPQQAIDQLVLQGESFSGRHEGTGDSIHDQWLLDPNQALAISETYEPYWDSKRKVVVNVFQLRPISEPEVEEYDHFWDGMDNPFGKSLQGTAAVEFEHLHPRDQEGQFAPKHSVPSGVAPTATLERADTAGAAAALRAKLGLADVDAQPAPRSQRKPNRRQRRQRLQRRQVQPAAAALPGEVKPLAQTKLNQQVALKHSVRLETMRVAIEEAMIRRAESLNQLPTLNDNSRFLALNKGDWQKITEVVADEDLDYLREKKGNRIPFGALFQSRVTDRKPKKGFANAQQTLVNNAMDDLATNSWNIIDEALGQPFFPGKTPHAIGDHIIEAFEDHPEIDQITIYEDPNTRYIQLYGNARPVAPQIILEIDEGVELGGEADLELLNAGGYRTMNVTIESDGELKPVLPLEVRVQGVGAMSLPVQIIKVVAPKVGLRRVVGTE